MFRRRNRSLGKAVQGAADPELRQLRAEVARRQDEVARLELELFDTQVEVARFEQELERRLGPLQRRLAALEEQLQEARHMAERRGQWGDRLQAEDAPVDVVDQFRRTWQRSGRPATAPPPRRQSQVDPEALKTLYRQLAKRFHPDLESDPARKRAREKIMAEVNQAYAAGDLAILRELERRPDPAEAPPKKTRGQLIAALGAEVSRLDRLIATLTRNLDQLANSHTVKLMLDASIAQRAGGDMLGEMAAELRTQIAQLEIELTELGG